MKLVFLLEEPSVKEMLNSLLPRLLPESVEFICISYEGKSDLEKRLKNKLRGWKEPGVKFVIMRDQDNGDCIQIKNTIVNICHESNRKDALVRIACRELESWYIGDLTAVHQALNIKGIVDYEKKEKYRIPDAIEKPSKE